MTVDIGIQLMCFSEGLLKNKYEMFIKKKLKLFFIPNYYS